MTVIQLATDQLVDVPLPAGAVKVFDWEHPDRTGRSTPTRQFNGTTRVVELPERHDDVAVLIEGTQCSDGRVERAIRVLGDGVLSDELTLPQAAELADNISDAVTEAHRMTRLDAPTAEDARKALLTAHDRLIEGHAHAALAAAGLEGARATRAVQLVDELHTATDQLGRLIDSLGEAQ